MIKIIGNEQAGHEVIIKLKEWDEALRRLDLTQMLSLHDKTASFYDLSAEFSNLSEYQHLWQDFKPMDHTEYSALSVSRRNIVIHADEHLVVLNALFKIEDLEHADIKGFGWCRQTMCWMKKNRTWKVMHQHLSVPIELESGIFKPILLKQKRVREKLR